MFGLDNNVLTGLVGVVLVFCLMTNKKSFKSLMKKDMLIIVGLTLLLACCISKGGRIVEGYGEEFNMRDFLENMEASTSATRGRHCGRDGKDCTSGHHGILDTGGQIPVFKQELITEELIDDHRNFLSYLKGSGMGGIEHIEHNLEARARQILPALGSFDNLITASSGDRGSARDAMLQGLTAVNSVASQEEGQNSNMFDNLITASGDDRGSARDALLQGLTAIQSGASREEARNQLRTIQQGSGATNAEMRTAIAELAMLQDGRSFGELAELLGR
jgi:hypothetical protein